MKGEGLPQTLAGRNALVTGAGSGIGRATATMMARCGARVALLGRTRESLDQTLAEIGGKEAGHLTLVADIGDESQMSAMSATVAEVWSHLDILVANAGINGVWAPLDQLKVSEWDTTLQINLRGTFLTVKELLPLLKRRGGSVIVVSSINGTRIFSNSGATAYASSKAAQVAFAKMVALELAKDHIRVNVVCPGAIRTNIDDSTVRRDLDDLHLPVELPEGVVPLTGGGSGSANQVAELIAFLASDAAALITGTEVYVDGAQSLL